MYEVRATFPMLSTRTGSVHMERSSYLWVTPYPTKKAAELRAAYIEKHSRATNVEVVKVEDTRN